MLDIKELAIFLDCQVMTPIGECKMIGVETKEMTGDEDRIWTDNQFKNNEWHPSQVKPILRLEEDLCTDEINVLRKYMLLDTMNGVWIYTPFSFQIAIAFRVDIFDWIKKGEAIRKV